MKAQNLLCLYHCQERVPLEGEDKDLATQNYFILYCITEKGLVDRDILEEVKEDFFQLSAHRPREVVDRDSGPNLALSLGPFANLAGAQELASVLGQKCAVEKIFFLSVAEYNNVMESIGSVEAPNGHLLQILMAQGQELVSASTKEKRGLLGKIFN